MIGDNMMYKVNSDPKYVFPEMPLDIVLGGKYKEVITDKYVYFKTGPLSQWTTSPFNAHGIRFLNCEQYMMYRKALAFNDVESIELIKQTPNPPLVKDIGRKVKGFEQWYWDKIKMDVVIDGNKEKFAQNPHLRKYLLSTGDKILVEATREDSIWGIGVDIVDLRIDNNIPWNGSNLLGEALMIVRRDCNYVE